MENIVLPFKQTEIYLGLAEISGLLRIVDDVLEIEYQVKDTTLGFLDSSVKSCQIPLRIIDSVEVEKKWFSGKFELTFTRIPALDNPFQLENNRLKLSVKKQHLDKAKAFRAKLMYEILELKLDHLDENGEEETEYRPPKNREAFRTQKPKEEDTGRLKNMLRDSEK